MDADLPGGSWDFGPRGERINGRYNEPIIMQDASTLRSRLAIRAGFIADYLEIEHSNPITDVLANQLRRFSVRVGFADAHIIRRDAINEDELRKHGATINKGFRGLWAVVQNLDAVKESLESED